MDNFKRWYARWGSFTLSVIFGLLLLLIILSTTIPVLGFAVANFGFWDGLGKLIALGVTLAAPFWLVETISDGIKQYTQARERSETDV